MININLPFWLDGIEIGKLKDAITKWWNQVESWLHWPLTQLDPLSCSLGLLYLIAYQRDVERFVGEPESLFRRRVKFALINAQEAGSTAGFIRIFNRLGIGYVEVIERFDAVNWDIVRLQMTDSQIASNTDLLQLIVTKYGRTCRRYEFLTITPVSNYVLVLDAGHTYSYDVARKP